MGVALKLAASQGVALRDVPALAHGNAWEAASASQRAVAELHFALVKAFLEPRSVGAETMAANLVARLATGSAPAETMNAAAMLKRGLSAGNVRRLIAKARTGGVQALLPGHTGKRRKVQGWEPRALLLWDHPTKRTYAAIALQLCMEGFEGVTATHVRRYLNTLPTHMAGKQSIQRVGPRLYKQTREHYQKRHLDDVLVGEIYAGDGHTCDCYVRHPNSGGLFRAELTVFIDIKSRYISGWHVSESETKESTLFALSRALITHDHVPGWLYLDHGAGYRAQMLSDAETGFFKKFEIAVTAAIPGNPRGKGWIESFFHTLRDRHDKFFAGGWTYCGDDMAKETNRRLHIEIRNGKRSLPTLDEYIQSVAAWIEQYHDTPHSALADSPQGKTPRQVWSALNRVRLHTDADAVMRPAVMRTVRQRTVTLHNRRYFHELLLAYDGKSLYVEYDLQDDAKVWIRDEDRRLVCEAPLDSTVGVLPVSRLEEQRDRREAAQVKRRQRDIEEVRRRRQDPITHESQLKALEDMGGTSLDVIEGTARDVPEPLPIPAPVRAPRIKTAPAAPAAPHDDDEPHIDITDWSAEE